VCYHIWLNTTLPAKAKCSVFIYSLFVDLMYISANKVTFIVKEIITPIIRNSKIFTINTTSLSDNKVIKFGGNTHPLYISFPMAYNISHFLLFVYMTDVFFYFFLSYLISPLFLFFLCKIFFIIIYLIKS